VPSCRDYNTRVPDARPLSLDLLAANILARYGYRFTVATDEAERDVAYRLRYLAVVEQGWAPASAFPDGRDRDAHDDGAVHIVGWDGDTAVATGRLVLPPRPLPTEEVCGITIEPRGRVADVGRMTVASGHQGTGHAAFLALLARLYLEVRARGYEVACGLMSARARSLMRLLGVQIEVLGDERPYCGAARAPVRFTVVGSSTSLTTRWQ
jgi:GNAT superfamily N-acetyltransferase